MLPKIKRNTIIGEKKNGGLKICDFKVMEKAPQKMGSTEFKSQAPRKITPIQLLHKHGSLAFLTKYNSTTSILDLDYKLPKFY